MGLFTTAKNVHEKGSILKNLYKILLVIFVIGILFISIKLSIDTNPEAGLKFIGNLLLYPTLELQDSSQALMKVDTLWINTGDMIKDLVNNFILYDKLIMSLFAIIFIFTIIFWLFNKMIQNSFISFIVSICVFIVIEMLTASILKNVSPFTPFYAIIDFFKLCWKDFELFYDKIKGTI